MFPFVRLLKPSGLASAMLIASLVVLNLTSTYLNQAPTNIAQTVVPSTHPDITYLDSMESHLQAKALNILKRYSNDHVFVDLNIELESTAVTTTTYVPGERICVSKQSKMEDVLATSDTKACSTSVVSQNWELTGTWKESNEVRPRIKTIRCCVTLTDYPTINADDLYRSLSYGLGINLSRGDILKIVYR